MTVPLRLIIGIGNPGAQYAKTRHNAGFWLIDRLAEQHQAIFRAESRFHSQVARLLTQDCWLLKPETFVNRSGEATAAFMRFYNLPEEQTLVIHDDLALPPGAVRLKRGGGHGGHNGLRNIIQHLGNNNFLRLRLGIGHPGQKDEVVDYVLGNPSLEDHIAIHRGIESALAVMPAVLAGELDKAMNALHRQE